MDFDLNNLSEKQMMDQLAEHANIVKARLNISAEEGAEEKLGKLLGKQQMISQLRVYGCEVDMLSEIDAQYEMLYSLRLQECTFSNQQTFKKFLSYLKKTTGLRRLTFGFVKMN